MANTNNTDNTENTATQSKVNVSNIIQGAAGGAGALATAYSTYANVQDPKNWIERANNYQINTSGISSFDDLTQAYLNNGRMNHIGLSDVGFNKGQGIMNIASSSMQGAGAGAAFGPWGALIGGVAGLAGGIFGYAKANKKAKRTVADSNEAIDAANEYNRNALSNTLGVLQDKQYNTLSANYAALGGPLNSYGADWSNGLIFIGNGGTHEQNPYEGVQMGIAPDGQPNLVEEGEVIWNDYVFSKRLKVPKAVREKYKFKDDKITFADAVLEIQKESEERPNDPISKMGLNSTLAKLAMEQENIREKKGMEVMFGKGGSIHIAKNKRGTFTAAASKHGKSVQEFASQVLAHPENYSPAMRKKANFARNAKKWKHADGGHLFAYGTPGSYFDYDDFDMARMFSIPPVLNPIQSSRHIYSSLDEPWVVGNTLPETNIFQVPVKNKKGEWVLGKPQEWGALETPEARAAVRSVVPGTTSRQLSITTPPPITGSPKINVTGNRWESLKNIDWGTRNKRGNSWLTGLRYIPAIGAGLGVFSNLMGWTNKPDYSSADAILEASRGVRDVSFNPIGDYMAYNPFDRMFYLNQLNANAGATRRAIINQSAGNRGTAMAGILAADNNAMNSIGNLARQAEEYNLAQRQKVAEFNRGTNMFNSEGFLKAQQANQGAAEVRMRAAQAAAAMRDAIDQRVGVARSANLTNLFESLGDIGREEFAKQMILGNRGLYYDWMGNYKGKNGGYITIKNKRRRR